MRDSRNVVYVTAGWMPTQQANGLQTVSMCKAFAKLGLGITLYYIPSPKLKDDPIRYYDVKAPLVLKPLPRAVLPLRKSFALQKVTSLPSHVHAFIWSGFVTHLVSQSKADFYFVREPMIAWWLGRRGLPTVLEIHDIPRGIERMFIRRASRQSSVKLVLAVTDHLRADLVKQCEVPAEKMLTLHDGIELETPNGSINKEKARQRFGLPLDKPLVVYTGMIDPEKGLDVLAHAAPMLNGIHIVIVGYGTQVANEELRGVIRKANANNVTVLGFKPHSDALLFQKAADVLVLPHSMKSLHSAYYTSPLKLFEYMAAGVPIVASALPAMKEVLRDGENGCLVQPDSPSALANGILRLLGNKTLASAMAQRAARDAESYTWEHRATRIIKSLTL